MKVPIVARIVGWSSRNAGFLVPAIVLLALGAAYYSAHHFRMDSRTEGLISSQTQWRKREARYDAAFPQQSQLIDIVVDGATPERAEEAAGALAAALQGDKTHFAFVRRPDDGAFFAHDGLLFLPVPAVKDAMQKAIGAQAFLGALASDPSLRGIADNLSTAMQGVQHGQARLADLDRPMASLGATLDAVLAARPAFLSWRSLVSGSAPSLRETRRFIEARPVLDYGRLQPGLRATAAIRAAVQQLALVPSMASRCA